MVTSGLGREFTAAAVEAGAEVIEAADGVAAALAVAELLQREGIDTVAAEPGGAELEDRVRVIRPRSAAEFAGVPAAIVRADFGAAETGTLVRLDFADEEKLAWTLPPLCVCLLERRAIVPGLESLVPVLSGHLNRRGSPGPQVSLVTGPSRTADIECQLTIGVQGPARLVIVLIGDEAA